ncbi:MAG: hypothetical protein LBQ43_05175 [Holosporales bacterium]|jgi:hypothetical protein|nr:hypothetical protein [Holosporales bacterium]
MHKNVVVFFWGASTCLVFYGHCSVDADVIGTGFREGPPEFNTRLGIGEGGGSLDSRVRMKETLRALKSDGWLRPPAKDSVEVKYARGIHVDRLEDCGPKEDDLLSAPLEGDTDLERRSSYFMKVSSAVAEFSHYVVNEADRWIHLLEKNTVKNKIQYRGSFVDLSSAGAAVSSCRGVWDAALIYAEGLRFFLLAGLTDYAKKTQNLYFETLGMGRFVPVNKTTQLFASSVFGRSLCDMHALAGGKGLILENPKKFGIETIPLNVCKELGLLDRIVSEALCKDGPFSYPSICRFVQVGNEMLGGVFADVMDVSYVLEDVLLESGVSLDELSRDVSTELSLSEGHRRAKRGVHLQARSCLGMLGVNVGYVRRLRVKLLEISQLISICQNFDGRVSLVDRFLVPTLRETSKKMNELSDSDIRFIGRHVRSNRRNVWRSPQDFRKTLSIGDVSCCMATPECWGERRFDSLAGLLKNPDRSHFSRSYEHVVRSYLGIIRGFQGYLGEVNSNSSLQARARHCNLPRKSCFTEVRKDSPRDVSGETLQSGVSEEVLQSATRYNSERRNCSLANQPTTAGRASPSAVPHMDNAINSFGKITDGLNRIRVLLGRFKENV